MSWNVLSSIVSPVANYFSKRSDNKTAVKTKHIERLASADDKLAEWEAIQAENGRHSWKDEFWTIILSIPMILCFIPEFVPNIHAGFKALEEMPDFYQYWLGVAVLTSFGVRFTKR